MAAEKQSDRMEKLVSLCKRRGFIFPASEIYGGLNGFWDYGPMGVLLKRNIKDAWWNDMVTDPPIGPDGVEISMVGLDSAIIQNPRLWEASGHLKGFTDPMIDCKECKARFRADKVFGFKLVRPNQELDDGLKGQEDKVVLEGTVEADGRASLPTVLPDVIKRLARAKNIGVLKKQVTVTQFEPVGQSGATFTVTGERDFWFAGYSGSALDAEHFNAADAQCPSCQAVGTMTNPRQFNMMFKTFVGASEDSSAVAYLRPETAGGIFVNYLNVVNTSRVKVPFGIAQVGKAFRNEINPRNFTFRSREFEQMEIEFFCAPEESMKWYEFWRTQRINWYKSLGLASDHLRPREQDKDELAHYSKACTDIEYLFPFSEETQELEGCAHRGEFDLRSHQEASGKDMSFFDDEAWLRDQPKFAHLPKDEQDKIKNAEPYRFVPHVIEPSAGADRFTLAVLCEAFTEDSAPDEKGIPQPRTVMKFHPRLAPIKVAVFPLVRKDGMPEIATDLYRKLKRRWSADYDDKGAVGRRYRRHDEIGTPFCITIDGQTKEDNTVTIRDRDSMEQVRIPLAEVEAWIAERLRKSGV
ncbi:MAG: glycine--tRNA ligase [Phycisphaerae bacterium]|nr:glycine--tRNA ligase [Phycisphaerae bacterium]